MQRIFFKLQSLIRDHTEEIAKSITTEQVRSKHSFHKQSSPYVH